MKALTICQPYAHLIATGEKWVENRTWETFYRGTLAIHAGKSRAWLPGTGYEDNDTLVFGAVVAIADLVACEHLFAIVNGKSTFYKRLQAHPHAEGPFCWVLENVRPIQPVPCSGRQGLWNWTLPRELRA